MSRKRYRLMRTRVANRQSACEHLESRRMLAGDFQAGDANNDYYFDEADWVQVFKFDKFDTGEAASWEEGDWDGDGLFNGADVVSAVRAVGTKYRMGPYDDDAGPAVNQLLPLAVTGEADMTIFYLPESGDVIAIAPAGTTGTTSLHLESRSGSFSGIRGSVSLIFQQPMANSITRLAMAQAGLNIPVYCP